MYWSNFLHIYQPPTQTEEIVRKVTDHACETARKMFGSIRNLVELLKESLQRDRLTEVDDGFDAAAIQIRFNTS